MIPPAIQTFHPERLARDAAYHANDNFIATRALIDPILRAENGNAKCRRLLVFLRFAWSKIARRFHGLSMRQSSEWTPRRRRPGTNLRIYSTRRPVSVADSICALFRRKRAPSADTGLCRVCEEKLSKLDFCTRQTSSLENSNRLDQTTRFNRLE